MASPAAEGFRADLRHQNGQASRATLLLEQAVACMRAEELDERPCDRAQRLRGVAVLVQTASIEIAITCGWLEAANAAMVNGIWPEPEGAPG